MGKSKSSDDRLNVLEAEIKDLKRRLAMYEGQDIIRRFRHHVMYDVVKTYDIKLPPRMNPKKRTNFPFVLKAIRNSESKLPAEWLKGLEGLEKLDGKSFPIGFWDQADNNAVTTEMIDSYIAKLPADEEELKSQIKAMCQCSLLCVPPCARGNGNTPAKGDKVAEIESVAKAVVDSEQKTSHKKAKKSKSKASKESA